ncbi:YcxB family protein [bacterium]|nr:YcxB family protein [bacterium]
MIENSTKMGIEEITALNKLTVRGFWYIILLLGIIMLLSLPIGIMTGDYTFFIAMVIAFLLFGLIIIYSIKAAPNKYLKSFGMAGGDAFNNYKFREEFLEIAALKNEEIKGWSKIYYHELFKVTETDKYFFIYISIGQAHVLDKRGFLSGTPQDLAMLLQQKLGNKFGYKYRHNMKN